MHCLECSTLEDSEGTQRGSGFGIASHKIVWLKLESFLFKYVCANRRNIQDYNKYIEKGIPIIWIALLIYWYSDSTTMVEMHIRWSCQKIHRIIKGSLRAGVYDTSADCLTLLCSLGIVECFYQGCINGVDHDEHGQRIQNLCVSFVKVDGMWNNHLTAAPLQTVAIASRKVSPLKFEVTVKLGIWITAYTNYII